jgi:hypothetical protein
MGVIKNLQLDLSEATSTLWGAMREVEYLRTAPDWKRASVALELEEARKRAKEARQSITALKRKYRIKKRGYNISISDLPPLKAGH